MFRKHLFGIEVKIAKRRCIHPFEILDLYFCRDFRLFREYPKLWTVAVKLAAIAASFRNYSKAFCSEFLAEAECSGFLSIEVVSTVDSDFISSVEKPRVSLGI